MIRRYGWLVIVLLTTASGWAAKEKKPKAPPPPPRFVTVQATVFEDANADGRQDPGEPPLADISASDGVEWKKSGADGGFEFKLDESVTGTVFVCSPAGWRPSRHFYLIADFEKFDGKVQTGAIGLVRDPARDTDRFCFVQLTDTHVTEGGVQTMIDDLQVVNRLTDSPAFVLATGDLVDSGSNPGQLQGYLKSIEAARYPYYSVIGNHDYGGDGLRQTQNYERYIGPRYYSFTSGRYHFIAKDVIAEGGKDPKAAARQEKWIEQDVALNAAGKRIIVLQHFLPANREFEFWGRFNTAAIFSGHWHGRHERLRNGILDVNSATFRFGGIDRSPRGFRVVHVDGDKLTCEWRVGQQEKRAEVIYPAEGASVGGDGGRVRIQALAYDTATRVKDGTFRVELAGSARPIVGSLTASGRWMWTGEFAVPAGLSNHDARLVVELAASDGTTWQAKSAFQLNGRLAATPRMGEPWRFFHRDAGHRGYLPDGPKPPLSLAWTTNVGGTVLLASPVIADDRVYVGTGFAESLDDCAVYALDLASGRVLWRTPVDSSIQHSLAAWEDNILAVSQAAFLYCFDRKGNQKWRASLAHEESHRWELSFPVTDGKAVYAGRCNGFGAYQLEDGKPVWKQPGGADWWPSVYSGPSLGTGLVYQGGAFCRALDQATGNVIWNQPKTVVSTVAVVPAVVERDEAGDRLYVFQNGKTLLCLEGKTGKTLWEASRGPVDKSEDVPLGNETGTPAVGEKVVCIGGGQVKWADGEEPSAAMHGFDKKTGRLLWRYPVTPGLVSSIPYQRGESTITGSPVIVGEVVYFGASDGYIYALDVNSGSLVWRYRVGVPIASTMAVSGNTIAVVAWDGTVYAFTADSTRGEQ